MKISRRFLSTLLALVMLCSLTSVSASASTQTTPIVETSQNETIMPLATGLSGFNQKLSCYAGPLYINVTGSDKSTGYVTLRINTTDQSTPIYFNLYNPNGTLVLSRDFETGGPIYPNNGNEIVFSFRSAPAGTYRLEFTGVSGTPFDMLCWIYG